MAKYRIFIARFPSRGDGPDTTEWLVKTVVALKKDPRVDKVMTWFKADTPITMTRNYAMYLAKKAEADFIIMIDDDMKPDMYLRQDPTAKEFIPTAFDFLTSHTGPGFIAVPYCGPPPIENIYVFKWCTLQSNHPNIDFQIQQYTREEAAVAQGIEEVAALPTGLCMFHTTCLNFLTPPYFDYEWKKGENGEDFRMEKASTEDVYMTRNLAFAGIPIYVLWDSWAGHWKRKCVGKPGRIDIRDVAPCYLKTVADDLKTQYAATGHCRVCGHGEPRKTVGPTREQKAVATRAFIEKQRVQTAAEIQRAMDEKFSGVEEGGSLLRSQLPFPWNGISARPIVATTVATLGEPEIVEVG